MLTGTAYSSRHLVPSHLGLEYVLLVETNPFLELVVIFLDYALRICFGTFSILLLNFGYGTTFATLTPYISKSCKNKQCSTKVQFDCFWNTYQLSWSLFIWHYNAMSVRFNVSQPWGLPEHVSFYLYKNIRGGYIMAEAMMNMYVVLFWLRLFLFVIKKDLSYVGWVQTVKLAYLIRHYL